MVDNGTLYTMENGRPKPLSNLLLALCRTWWVRTRSVAAVAAAAGSGPHG